MNLKAIPICIFFIFISSYSALAGCSCTQGSMATIVGVEYVACGTDVADDQVVEYTAHYSFSCSGTKFIKTYAYSNSKLDATPAGLANFVANNGNFRVFKTGSHIIATSKYFNGKVNGVSVSNYAVGQVHHNVITGCPHIFPPIGETDDLDEDGIVDCIDNCPEIYNPDQNPCQISLDDVDTSDKDQGPPEDPCE